MFEALNRVGQDPIPQPGKATGLAFSVKNARTVPSSLNIMLEVALEWWNVDINSGDLSSWASQEVLLLNTALTVDQGRGGSHIKHWAKFSELLIEFISENASPTGCVSTLGNHAQKYARFINTDKHYIISGGLPSTPRPGGMGVNNFFGGAYFLCGNEFLGANRGNRGTQID